MIYLSAENPSSLGEDTFWTWFHREVEPDSTFARPTALSPRDILLQYSTLGASSFPDNTVALLWELHPEMKVRLESREWDGVIRRIEDCARSAKRKTVSSKLMLPFYACVGSVDYLPIGVDTVLFRPMDKKSLRAKYGIPENKTVGLWCGTTHPMKGFDRLVQWKDANPGIHWIVVWKSEREAGNLPESTSFIQVTQPILAELMNCADFFLSCGRLRPFFLVEYEAMSCNLPIVIFGNEEKDFLPSPNPRMDIFERGWDRISAGRAWKNYLAEMRG